MNTSQPTPARPPLSPRDLVRALRPRQWTKNLVVLAAFFFALGDTQQHLDLRAFPRALLAAVVFSVVSSAVYVLNDIFDRALDRAHPVKRLRPVASGALSVPAASVLAAALAGIGMGGAWLVGTRFALCVVGYIALQAVYTLRLKHLPLLDVFVIAAGFVLRAVAGGFAVNVTISPWLLICTFLMALFLALCKRRHEKRLMEEHQIAGFRPSLESGDERLFDQLIAIVAGAVIIAYAVYTQWPETVAKFQTTRLSYTLPFVIFGLFRYLDLVYRQAKGDQPEYILLTDLPLILDILFFGLAVWWIVIVA